MFGKSARGHRTIRDVQDAVDDVYVLGLRESTRPEAWSLVFMAGEDDPDLDSYCIVVDPGQATTYGGVTRCAIDEQTPPVLRLGFTSEAAETLGLPADTTLTLDIGADSLALLRRGLHRVLTSGHPGDLPAALSL